MRNSDYKRIMESFSDIENNYHNIEYLVSNLDIDIHLKECITDVLVLVKNNKDSNSINQLKLISRVIEQVLAHADYISQQIALDPIGFDYLSALEASRDIKYKIAKEVRDYV